MSLMRFFQCKLSGTFFIRSQLWWNWPICMKEIQNLQIVHVTRFWAGIPRFWSCGNQFWWSANNHGLGAWENSGQNGKRPLTKRRRKEEEGEICLHILSPKSLKTREGRIFIFFTERGRKEEKRESFISSWHPLRTVAFEIVTCHLSTRLNLHKSHNKLDWTGQINQTWCEYRPR